MATALLNLLSYIAHDHNGGHTHSGLGPHTSIINKDNTTDIETCQLANLIETFFSYDFLLLADKSRHMSNVNLTPPQKKRKEKKKNQPVWAYANLLSLNLQTELRIHWQM